MTEGQQAGDDRRADAPGPPEGLGRSSTAGPAFRTGDPLPAATPPPWRPSGAPQPRPSQPGPPPLSPPQPGPPPLLLQPRRSRLPALLSVAVVAVVLAVVAAASAVARYADTHQPAAPARAVPVPAATSTPDPGSIVFTTARGSGRLRLVSRTWGPAPPGAAPSARHLRIRVELLCTRGHVGHAPEFFSLFDDRGRLVEASLAVVEPDPVPLGTLGPGERVRGHVAFDLPRGDVTLVMSDEVSSVTAIRVPG